MCSTPLSVIVRHNEFHNLAEKNQLTCSTSGNLMPRFRKPCQQGTNFCASSMLASHQVEGLHLTRFEPGDLGVGVDEPLEKQRQMTWRASFQSSPSSPLVPVSSDWILLQNFSLRRSLLDIVWSSVPVQKDVIRPLLATWTTILLSFIFCLLGPNPHMQSNQNLRKLPEILQATGHARSWVISHCCLLQLPFDFAREIRLGTSWRQRRKHQIWHCLGGSWELRKDKDKVILIVAPEAFSEWRLRSGGCNPIAPKLLCKRGLERLGTYVTALPLNVWGKKSQSCKVKPEHVMFAILLMAWDDNNSFSVIIVCFSTSKQCKTAQGWVQHGVLDILDRTSMWPPFPSKLVDDSHSPSRFKSKWAHSLSSLLPKFTVVVLLSAL